MLPGILPQLRDWDFIAADNSPGIVHQHIDMAKVLLGSTHHRLDLLAIAHVAPHPQAVSTACFDFLGHAVNTMPLPPDFSRWQILWSPLYVRKHDVCTLCCQFERRRSTDTPHAPSARNQGHFPL